jgi:hypothetical protein
MKAHRIDAWLWPYLCRKRTYMAILISLWGIYGLESAFPELGHMVLGGTITWGLFNAAVLVVAICVIDSRARYLEWKYRMPTGVRP